MAMLMLWPSDDDGDDDSGGKNDGHCNAKDDCVWALKNSLFKRHSLATTET